MKLIDPVNRRQVWLSCFLAAIFLSSAHTAYAKPVTVSILSILKSQSAKITLKSPERAILTTSSNFGDSESIVLSGSAFSIRTMEEMLEVSYSNGKESGSFREISISCNTECEIQIEIPGKISRIYSGGLHIKNINNTISIVLMTDSENLVDWISASEMAEHTEPAVLRAFAVVARSFLAAGQRHPSVGADFCDTTHCQVFQGPRSLPGIKEAVQSTSNLVLTYNDKIFRPFYSRLCGGKTAAYEDVWLKRPSGYPFYPVNCPCSDEAKKWKTTLTSRDLFALTGIRNATLNRHENQIRVSGSGSTVKYSAEEFRTRAGRAFGWQRIQANQFTVQQKGSVFEIQGNGIGHGVGFCQTGAAILASRGLPYSEILSAYFPNTELRNFNTEPR